MIIKLCFIQSIICLCSYCVSAGEYGLSDPDLKGADKNKSQDLKKKLKEVIDEKITELENTIIIKLEAITGLQYDMQRDIKVLKDKISEQTVNSTQIIELVAKETQIQDSIRKIASKLAVLENIPNQIQNNTELIQRLWNNCSEMNTSIEKPPQVDGLGTNTPESVTKPTISISKYLPSDSGERYDLRGTVDKLDRSMISTTSMYRFVIDTMVEIRMISRYFSQQTRTWCSEFLHIGVCVSVLKIRASEKQKLYKRVTNMDFDMFVRKI